MTVVEGLARISPFRWRLEWIVLLVGATALVLTEQAREVRELDPYQIVQNGRSARATVRAARTERIDLGLRRGVMQQETRTYLDLDWLDDRGEARRIDSYRLEPETIDALGIDVAAERWPQQVQILYLDRAEARPRGKRQIGIPEQGVTAAAFQQKCRPVRHCRVVVLAPDVLSPAEVSAQNIDYVLERAPYALQLSLVVLLVLLGLRLAGVVSNRPSLE